MGKLNTSVSLSAYTTHPSNQSAIGRLWSLVLGEASILDAFRSYPLGRSYPAMHFTTGTPEVPGPCSSRTNGPFPSRTNTPSRYYRTVSRRTEPSSCGSLTDEQPDPWLLLHSQDDPSRQRCTKPRGRYVLSPATSLLPPG